MKLKSKITSLNKDSPIQMQDIQEKTLHLKNPPQIFEKQSEGKTNSVAESEMLFKSNVNLNRK